MQKGLMTPTEQLRELGWLVPQVNCMFPMLNYLNLGFTPNKHLHLPAFLDDYTGTTFVAQYHFHDGPHLPYSPSEKWPHKFFPGGVDTSVVSGVALNVAMPRGAVEFTDRQQKIISRFYDAEVAAQDEELDGVLDVIGSLGLFHNSIVILTADHSEELFDHGWIGHASTSLAGTLSDELVRDRARGSRAGEIAAGP